MKKKIFLLESSSSIPKKNEIETIPVNVKIDGENIISGEFQIYEFGDDIYVDFRLKALKRTHPKFQEAAKIVTGQAMELGLKYKTTNILLVGPMRLFPSDSDVVLIDQ